MAVAVHNHGNGRSAVALEAPPRPAPAFEHEEVVMRRGARSGVPCVVAVHSTALGPALGGLRIWHYDEPDDGRRDAMRLAAAMTLKASAAGLDLGGGKGVICAPPEGLQGARRVAALRDFGDLVESLDGRYITAEDVGTSVGDMEFIKAETDHVTGLIGKSGDPSPVTAFGVYRGMKAAARHRWGDDSVAGKTIAIQGCGHVGYYLADYLHNEGAKLIVTDIDPEKMNRVVQAFRAETVAPDAIYGVEADIFAPCALGGIINDKTLPQFQVEVIAGGANNQLAEERHGDVLDEKGITYAPDYVINAGGLVNVNAELQGWTMERARNKAGEIYDTILTVFDIAKEEGIPSYRAADRLAERRIAAIAKVRQNFV